MQYALCTLAETGHVSEHWGQTDFYCSLYFGTRIEEAHFLLPALSVVTS